MDDIETIQRDTNKDTTSSGEPSSSWLEQMADDDRKVLESSTIELPGATTTDEDGAKPDDTNEHVEDDGGDGEIVEPKQDEDAQDAPRGAAAKSSEDRITDRVNREIAFTTLKRLGMSDELIKSMGNAPTGELQGFVAKVKANQAANDGMGSKLKAAQEEIERLKAGAKSKDDGQPEDPIEALKKHFTDMGDEDAASLIDKAFSTIRNDLKAAQDTLKTVSKPDPDRESARLLADLAGPMDRINRAYGGKEFATAESRKDLLHTANMLVDGGFFDLDERGVPKASIDEVLDKAASIRSTSGRSIRDAQQRTLADRISREKRGQINTDIGSNKPQGKSPADPDRLALKMLAQGKSPEYVNRKLFSRS